MFHDISHIVSETGPMSVVLLVLAARIVLLCSIQILCLIGSVFAHLKLDGVGLCNVCVPQNVQLCLVLYSC